MTEQLFNQTENILAETVFVNKHADHDFVSENWTRYHTGAFVGLIGGFVILLGAIFLTVFEYFAGEKSHSFWLFLSIYPMFAVGAHCLDKLSELKKEKENVSHENDIQNL